MRLVLLGPPGAGKGTQASRIAQAYDIPQIATGDIFRENVRNGTELGDEAKEYMDRGELAPDDLVIRMVTDRLGQDDAQKGFLLDGFPRTTAQAEALEEFLTSHAEPLTAVLRYDIPEEEVVNRITKRRVCPEDGSVYHLDYAPPKSDEVCDQCGTELIQRDDDTEEVVRNRMEEYREKTAPLEQFYAERGQLHEVEAQGEVSEITDRSLAVLSEVSGPQDAKAEPERIESEEDTSS